MRIRFGLRAKIQSMNSYLLLFFAASLDALGNFFFKKVALTQPDIFSWSLLSNPWLYIGAVCFLSNTLGFLSFLQRFPLSVAFPLYAGGTFIATLLLGFFVLGETLSVAKIIGIGMILAGIAVASQ